MLSGRAAPAKAGSKVSHGAALLVAVRSVLEDEAEHRRATDAQIAAAGPSAS